jgi:CDP-glucose 4,6-dehydratase
VLDALSGYMMLAERLYSDGDKFVGAWNFGPASEQLWTVKKVVQKFCIPSDPKIEFEGIKDDTKKEKKWLNLDTSKANGQLLWAPKVPILNFLPRTRRWYEMNFQGTTADLLCKQELDYYQTFK